MDKIDYCLRNPRCGQCIYPHNFLTLFKKIGLKNETNKKERQEWEQRLWEVYKPSLYDKKELELFAKLENQE